MSRHDALRATWAPGQYWETAAGGYDIWVPVGDAGRAQPLWDEHQEYRRRPDLEQPDATGTRQPEKGGHDAVGPTLRSDVTTEGCDSVTNAPPNRSSPVDRDTRDAALWREFEPKWRESLNRRATVEQWMFDAARGKRPMPMAQELREWALKLGTPGEVRAAVSPRVAPIRLGSYVNAAHISAADMPHTVVQKLQAAIDAATGAGVAVPAGECSAPACDCDPEWGCIQRVPATFYSTSPRHFPASDQELHDALVEWYQQSDGITVGIPSELVKALVERLAPGVASPGGGKRDA